MNDKKTIIKGREKITTRLKKDNLILEILRYLSKPSQPKDIKPMYELENTCQPELDHTYYKSDNRFAQIQDM